MTCATDFCATPVPCKQHGCRMEQLAGQHNPSFAREAGDGALDLDALRPCPFCGGHAERQEIEADECDPNAGGIFIECDKCGACSAVHFDRKENLVDSWNRRAAQPDRAPERGCPDCSGTGAILEPATPDLPSYHAVICQACNGTGLEATCANFAQVGSAPPPASCAPADVETEDKLLDALKQCVEALRGQHGRVQGRASKKARAVIAEVEAKLDPHDDSTDWYSSVQLAEMKNLDPTP